MILCLNSRRFQLCSHKLMIWKQLHYWEKKAHVLQLNHCIGLFSLLEKRDSKWAKIYEAKSAASTRMYFVLSGTAVDAWFSLWIENLAGDLAPDTLRNYREQKFLEAALPQPQFDGSGTLYAILTPRGRSKAVCSPRCCKSCWVMPA